MRRAAFLVAGLLGASTVGCTSQYLPRNAPGNVDPAVRPRTTEDRSPEDPGEQMLLLAYGGQAAVGTHVTSVDHDLVGTAGGEASVFYGRTASSTTSDDWLWMPETLFGASVGAQAISSQARRPSTLAEPAPELYGEAALRAGRIFGLGLGWAVDLGGAGSGPQGTANVGPLYVRVTRLLGEETFVTVGLVVKFQHAFVWSR